MNQSERTERNMETEKDEENNPIYSLRSVNHSQSTHWQIHALLWR